MTSVVANDGSALLEGADVIVTALVLQVGSSHNKIKAKVFIEKINHLGFSFLAKDSFRLDSEFSLKHFLMDSTFLRERSSLTICGSIHSNR